MEEDYDWQDLKRQLENIVYFTINYKDMAGIHRQDTLSRICRERRLCEFWLKMIMLLETPYGVIYRNTDYARKNYFAAKNTLDAYGLFIERT